MRPFRLCNATSCRSCFGAPPFATSGRTDEKANPSREGGARPRDSTSQPGSRIGAPTGSLLSHSVSRGWAAMQQSPADPRHRFVWRQKVRQPLSISAVVVAVMALVVVLLPAPAMAISLTGGAPSATTPVSSPSIPPVGGESTSTSITTKPTTMSPLAPRVANVATAAASKRPSCLPDPSAAIEALPYGGVWNGRGKCYIVSNAGIAINQPVTVENALFINPQKLTKGVPKHHFMRPFITVGPTSDVTLQNLNMVGENATASYHGLPWVNEEGIKLNSTHHVTISNITTYDTFGDGLILDQASGKGACENVTVNNYTINSTGRQGVTLASVEDSTLDNVHIGQTAESGWDFESDSAAGSGNITVNNASGAGVHMNEPLFGPVTFNNPDITAGHVWILNAAAASRQPVTFNGGTILLPIYDNGSPPAGITVEGPGNLTFNNVNIGNVPSAYVKPHGASWIATNGAHITFNRSTPTGPAGSHDATSKVTFKRRVGKKKYLET